MNIGIYLGYSYKVALDGEGVGRYVVRLVEGLLQERTENYVHILSKPPNIAEVKKMFARLKTLFGERIVVHCSKNINWINENVPVDLWIVPAVVIDSAQFLTKPLIVCLHDVAYIHFRELEDLGLRVDGLVRELTGKAAAVICNSNYIRTCDGLDYLRLPAANTHVIRPAAPVEEYGNISLPNERDFRNHYGLDQSYFVFPSIVRPHKNHVRLLDAFLRFRQTQPAGQPGPYLVFTDQVAKFCQNDKVLQIARQYDPSTLNCVKCLGRLPASDVPALYKYASGTVVPTLYEGSCPFPILESLTMGTPVAFSRIDMTTEVISDLHEYITFDPYDVDDIQRALGELWAGDPGMAQKQKAALSDFLGRSWRDVAREYYEIIDRIVRYPANKEHGWLLGIFERTFEQHRARKV